MDKGNRVILVVDDDLSTRTLLCEALLDEGFEVASAADGDEARQAIKKSQPDIVLTDLVMRRVGGMELLEHVRESYPEIQVIVMTGYGSIESAVEAMRLGAGDYLTKPIQLDELLISIRRLLETKALRDENLELKRQVHSRYRFDNIVGVSPQMQAVFSLIERVAPTDVTVMIRGETGTGKEMVARAIHYNSRRADKPLISVSCPSFAENLVEAEIFGHEKGAFTGAYKMKPGRLDKANQGTLFLDEVGDLSLGAQKKLLRVLQTGEYERVGGERTLRVDTRLITATNRNLEEMVREHTFREDLYYRLAVVPIDIPPLRERRDDILPLVSHFCREISETNHFPEARFSRSALQRLVDHSWPGNVRELRNVLESLIVLNAGREIDEEHLPAHIGGESLHEISVSLEGDGIMDNAERNIILSVIARCHGNKRQAAKVLGIGAKTLYRRLARYKEEGYYSGDLDLSSL